MLILILIGLLAAQIAASIIRVDVGSRSLSFTPEVIRAEEGDVLEFHFYPQNHSVVMGDFSKPCMPKEGGGVYSGLQSIGSGTGDQVFKVTINDTEPTFFYCGEANHCALGMAGVVNPSLNQTLAGYARAAVGKPSFSPHPPEETFGGELGKPEAEEGTGDLPNDDSDGDDDEEEEDDDDDGGGTLNVSVMGLLGSVSLAFLVA